MCLDEGSSISMWASEGFRTIACHLLSADNDSLPAQTKHRALENMKVTTTVLQLNQMIVMGCESRK